MHAKQNPMGSLINPMLLKDHKSEGIIGTLWRSNKALLHDTRLYWNVRKTRVNYS